MDVLPIKGAPMDKAIYYDTRPSAFPVGLMPRTSYALGGLGCYQGEAAVAEMNDRLTSNNQSHKAVIFWAKALVWLPVTPARVKGHKTT